MKLMPREKEKANTLASSPCYNQTSAACAYRAPLAKPVPRGAFLPSIFVLTHYQNIQEATLIMEVFDMSNLTDLNNAVVLSIPLVPLIAAGLVTPGYIILFMISRFTTGRTAFTVSIGVSSVYYVIMWTLLRWGSVYDVAQGIRQTQIDWKTAVVVVVIPAVIGIFIGLLVQREWLYDLLRLVRLSPVHGIPSAWDWKFMASKSQWITVHLENGDEVCALYDANCFVSTDPRERDLYLSNVHRWEDKTLVEDERVEGVLLKGDSIKRIEFHSF